MVTNVQILYAKKLTLPEPRTNGISQQLSSLVLASCDGIP